MSELIVFLPLFSGLFCGIFSKFLSHKTASIIAIVSLCTSAILAVKLLVHVYTNHLVLHNVLDTWITFEGINIHWAIFVDELTAVMFTVVTVVSAIVHIYSYGYMHDDKNLPRFMSYLSLFTFFMLALVASDNFVQLFFGWEGVGLCSYLLIGFWYHKDSASSAAVKAFIVNRVGDLAFILGILTIIYFVGSTDFDKVFNHAQFLSTQKVFIANVEIGVLELICMLLFIGCMGKSAQIGLHVWLPDAMEGPTPVSALIHAATMVTAGVFLVGRCSSLFVLAPLTSQIILWIGAITCLFAATTAIAQTDIKKIIAYSTCSQLGYMFMACGSLAYSAGIFHLVTHAFFKAMLFLAAGLVIHSVHEQDVTKMGGLYKKMPITYLFFWLGSLAIIGIYPFSGYYSKDLILESVFLSGNQIPFFIGLCAAFFTALYSIKILILVFHGKETTASTHAHEGPAIMTIPLMILAIGSIFAGSQLIEYFTIDTMHEISDIIKYSPLMVGIFGMLVGVILYKFRLADAFTFLFSSVHSILKNKYFFDEIYERLFVRTTYFIAKCSRLFDIHIIDGFGPSASTETVSFFARITSALQTGYLFTYAFYMLLGVVGIMSWWLYKFIWHMG
jgi:NADH-quinone oxidoreductase subunit L